MLNMRIIGGILLVATHHLAAAGVYEDMLHAVRNDNAAVVSQLLGRGVDVNTVDPEGNSLLILAVNAGNFGVVKALLAARASVDPRNAYGETALMLAALKGHLEIVRQLLVHDAQVNPPAGEWTPLIYAAVKGSIEISRLLLAYGARINAAGVNGITALAMATREGHPGLAAFLLANDADPHPKSDPKADETTR